MFPHLCELEAVVLSEDIYFTLSDGDGLDFTTSVYDITMKKIGELDWGFSSGFLFNNEEIVRQVLHQNSEVIF